MSAARLRTGPTLCLGLGTAWRCWARGWLLTSPDPAGQPCAWCRAACPLETETLPSPRCLLPGALAAHGASLRPREGCSWCGCRQTPFCRPWQGRGKGKARGHQLPLGPAGSPTPPNHSFTPNPASPGRGASSLGNKLGKLVLASWAVRGLCCLRELALSCGNRMRVRRTEVLRTDTLPAPQQSHQTWGARHPYQLPRKALCCFCSGGLGKGKEAGALLSWVGPGPELFWDPHWTCHPREECSPRPALTEAPSGSCCAFDICFRACKRLRPLSRATPSHRRW